MPERAKPANPPAAQPPCPKGRGDSRGDRQTRGGAPGLPRSPCGLWPRRGRAYPTTFNPITPDTIRPMHSSRGHEALSPNSTMPSAAAPTAPIPVQIA